MEGSRTISKEAVVEEVGKYLFEVLKFLPEEVLEFLVLNSIDFDIPLLVIDAIHNQEILKQIVHTSCKTQKKEYACAAISKINDDDFLRAVVAEYKNLSHEVVMTALKKLNDHDLMMEIALDKSKEYRYYIRDFVIESITDDEDLEMIALCCIRNEPGISAMAIRQIKSPIILNEFLRNRRMKGIWNCIDNTLKKLGEK